MRVVAFDRLPGEWRPEIGFAVRSRCKTDVLRLADTFSHGVRNVVALTGDSDAFGASTLPCILDDGKSLEEGDVVALTPGVSNLRVLYRESDVHHTVFLTNRCNSNCLMCSQPPTRHDDSWLVQEAAALATHIRSGPDVIGFTGGEPLLLGEQLRTVLDAFHREHPSVQLEVLTNGRLFSERHLAEALLNDLGQHVMWMVPLYGHADFLHDFVVQTQGAFDQTIDGLLTLRAFQQPVQLRTVLIDPVLQILPEWCEFVCRNLPFVREVALMGCEPIGFALANREQCQVDLADWHAEIAKSVAVLLRAKLRVVIMNAPLCALPSELWRYAQQSISDWKNTYAEECDGCAVRAHCCGLFAWHEAGWQPTVIRRIREVANHEAI